MIYLCCAILLCFLIAVAGIAVSIVDIERYDFGLYVTLVAVVLLIIVVAIYAVKPDLCRDPQWYREVTHRTTQGVESVIVADQPPRLTTRLINRARAFGYRTNQQLRFLPSAIRSTPTGESDPGGKSGASHGGVAITISPDEEEEEPHFSPILFTGPALNFAEVGAQTDVSLAPLFNPQPRESVAFPLRDHGPVKMDSLRPGLEGVPRRKRSHSEGFTVQLTSSNPRLENISPRSSLPASPASTNHRWSSSLTVKLVDVRPEWIPLPLTEFRRSRAKLSFSSPLGSKASRKENF